MKTPAKATIRCLLFIAVLFFGRFGALADSSHQHVAWGEVYGGSCDDFLSAMQPTLDGGYILAGSSCSGVSGNKTSANFGGKDFWVGKGTNGVIQWQADFGGSGDDYLSSVQQTGDGGYILGGYSSSGVSGNKTSANFGGSDYWLVKVDGNGVKQWEASFGGSSNDVLNAVQQTSDGGYILAGNSYSGVSGNKTSTNLGGADYWLVKVDTNGVKQWEASFGGNRNDLLSSVQQTGDGGYILGGSSFSPGNSGKSGTNYGGYDYWLVKVDSNGVRQWDKTYGGRNGDFLQSVQIVSGGYLLAGYAWAGVSGNKTSAGYVGNDYWLVKVDASGNKLWEKTYGGSDSDILWGAQPTADGGYILAGYSYSGATGNKNSAGVGGGDYWLVKVDGSGVKQWDKAVGGSGSDVLLAAFPTSGDDGYILGGYSASGISGNKTVASYGNNDFWLVKLLPDPPSILSQPQSTAVFPGNTATFTVSADGAPPLSYQWLFNSNSIPGQTNSTLNLTAVTTSNAGVYSVIITNKYGSLTSSNATLYILPLPGVHSSGAFTNVDFTAAGYGGMRGIGSGTITLTGVSGTVTRAYLYWHGPGNSTFPNANDTVTFAGVTITGVSIGFSADNCWSFNNSQAYRADVTPLVTSNGAYTLANFLKPGVADNNGASLVVFYDDGNPANNRDVYLYDGNDSNIGSTYDPANWYLAMTNLVNTPGQTFLTLHVSDGQTFSDDSVTLNGAPFLSASANWSGDSVPNGPGLFNGGLWDIKTYDVTSYLTNGTTSLILSSQQGGDCLSLIVAMLSFPTQIPTNIPSAIITWTNAFGGNWNDATNWSPNQVPGSADWAEVTSNVTVNVTSAITVSNLVFDNATLLGSGSLTVGGTMTCNNAEFFAPVTVAASATVNFSSDATINYFAAPFTNHGTANWAGGNFTGDGGFIYNDGLWDAQGDNGFYGDDGSYCAFVNAGTLRKSGGTGTAFDYSNSGWTLTNGGTVECLSGTIGVTDNPYVQAAGLTLLNGGNLAADFGFNLNGGTLAGNNTVVGNVINNGGTVSPGLSPGQLTIDGDYTQTANGTLQIEIGGTTAGSQYDRLVITGTSQLDGTLNVTLTNSFSPTTNDQFTILSAAVSAGTFADFFYPSNSVGIDVLYRADNVTLEVTNTTTGLRISQGLVNGGNAPHILPPSVTAGGNLTVRFVGTPGITYTVEYTDSLSSPQWRKRTNIVAPNAAGVDISVFEFSESITTNRQRFYRLVYPAY